MGNHQPRQPPGNLTFRAQTGVLNSESVVPAFRQRPKEAAYPPLPPIPVPPRQRQATRAALPGLRQQRLIHIQPAAAEPVRGPRHEQPPHPVRRLVHELQRRVRPHARGPATCERWRAAPMNACRVGLCDPPCSNGELTLWWEPGCYISFPLPRIGQTASTFPLRTPYRKSCKWTVLSP